MNGIERIGFLHVAYYDFLYLLKKLDHPAPEIRALTMTDKLQESMNYYRELWEARN